MAASKSSPFHHTVQDADVEVALASSAMRKVLAACIGRTRSVKEICAVTDVPAATAYRIINRLVELDLIIVARSAMTPDGRPYDLFRSRLTSGALRVSAQGSHIEWELDIGLEDRLLTMWDQLRMVA